MSINDYIAKANPVNPRPWSAEDRPLGGIDVDLRIGDMERGSLDIEEFASDKLGVYQRERLTAVYERIGRLLGRYSDKDGFA